jgi:hypothetical protein
MIPPLGLSCPPDPRPVEIHQSSARLSRVHEDIAWVQIGMNYAPAVQLVKEFGSASRSSQTLVEWSSGESLVIRILSFNPTPQRLQGKMPDNGDLKRLSCRASLHPRAAWDRFKKNLSGRNRTELWRYRLRKHFLNSWTVTSFAGDSLMGLAFAEQQFLQPLPQLVPFAPDSFV